MVTTLVRAASAADLDVLTALRVSMFASMGVAGVDGAPWQEATRGWFADHLDDPAVALRVVEVDGEVVAGAVAQARTQIPSPSNTSGRVALISNVSTFEAFRGRGYGRLAFDAVLTWCREESGAQAAELFATGMGQELYARAGFTVHPVPAMRMPLRNP